MTLWIVFYTIETIYFIICILLAVAFTYTIITMVDHLVICWYYRIRWHIWICFASSASILFFLCSGLIIFEPILLKKFLIIPFLITALIFLIDIIWWLW